MLIKVRGNAKNSQDKPCFVNTGRDSNILILETLHLKKPKMANLLTAVKLQGKSDNSLTLYCESFKSYTHTEHSKLKLMHEST
jgi:hypothetical protein